MSKLTKALVAFMAIPIGFIGYTTKVRVDDFVQLRDMNEALYTDVSRTQEQVRALQSEYLGLRTFGIPFTDTQGIATMFKSISGFNIQSIKTLDASKGFAESGDYSSGSLSVDGLRIVFTVNDVQRALDILNSMQLPIINLSVRNGTIDVSFNTRQVA